jgi:hypothetical protein
MAAAEVHGTVAMAVRFTMAPTACKDSGVRALNNGLIRQALHWRTCMRVYLTPCCAQKDPALQGSGKAVTPDKLYMATPTRQFMETCMRCNVSWAIFSDLYGVWFSQVTHEWYEKNPDTLTEAEYETLRKNFDEQLSIFSDIRFYHQPGQLHPFHHRLLRETTLAEKVSLFTHLSEIA